MLIIGGHDYYDNFIQYGVDKSIILKRDTNEYDYDTLEKIYKPKIKDIAILDKKNKRLNITNNPIYFQNKYRMECGFANVIIGNYEYKGISILISENGKDETHYIWNFDSLNKLLEKYGFTHIFVSVKWMDYITKDFFDKQEVSMTLYNFLIKNEISIITVSFKFRYRNNQYYINNSNLADYEFYKRLDGYQTYQELSHWIGNVLLSSKQMPDITDDKIKIHKHGFDKWSFRKKSHI